MVKNIDFLGFRDERETKSFFKVLQGADISSENMRAIPHDFVRTLSENDLSRKMKIRAEWGKSWKVKISKNPRFYFMEKSGWEKFVRENFLGDSEFLTFTHQGKMRFALNMYNKDGKEMLQPRQNAPFLASATSRVKTENNETVRVKTENREEGGVINNRNVKKEAGSSGRRKLNFRKKKVETKTKFRDSSASASSSSAGGFTLTIKRSYVTYLAVPKSFTEGYMREGRITFKIHHPDRTKSWDVVYLKRERSATFSSGWIKMFKEYPLDLGDVCTFTVIEPYELLLEVS